MVTTFAKTVSWKTVKAAPWRAKTDVIRASMGSTSTQSQACVKMQHVVYQDVQSAMRQVSRVVTNAKKAIPSILNLVSAAVKLVHLITVTIAA